jgi:hypothetical protein
MLKRLTMPIVLLLIGAIAGLVSARQMMATESIAAGTTSGWIEILSEDDSFNAFYTTAHFLQRGEVPPPRGARFFMRTVDDDGNELRGDCLVSVEGKMPNARWWMLNAASGAQRSSMDAGQVVRETNGDMIVAFAVTPTPGNWVVPPYNGAYELQLVIHGLNEGRGSVLALPRVKRLWC